MPINWQVACEKANRKCAFAWAKYYENIRGRIIIDTRHYETIKQMNVDCIPTHIKDEILAMGAELKKTWECPICIEMIQPDSLDITSCGHYFCKPCLNSHKATNATDCKCPVCRRPIYIKKD